MRIAFIVTHFPALSETFVLDQITGLIDRGHEVDIYAQSPANNPTVHADVEKYSLLDSTCYIDVRGAIPSNKTLRLTEGIARIFTNLRKKPIAVINSLNVLKLGREAASLKALYQIAPFLDRGPYDIVHCQFGPNGNLAVSLRDRGAIRGSIVTSFLGFDVSSYVRSKGHHVYDELFEKGDLFLCVSERVREKLIQLGCPQYKTLVQRLGIDTSKFSFLSGHAKNEGRVKLLTIARLVEKKGVHYGIRAVAKLLEQYPDIEYEIAGDGPLRTDLARLIDKLNVKHNISLLGWMCKEDIVGLMEEADILLAPSVTTDKGDEEGIPVVIGEALARGLPVVSTRHSGIPELVQDGVSGFLVPERDVDALADRIAYLISHPEIWPEMGKAGRKYIEQHYDINRLNDQLVQLYAQVLGKGNGRIAR